MGVDVEYGQVVAAARQRGLGGRRDATRDLDHGLELALGILINPVDARARKDVVELIDEQPLPAGIENGGRIIVVNRNRPDLSLTEGLFGAPVQPLGPRLRRVSPAMQLEIQLAHPRCEIARLLFRSGEEIRRAAELDLRRSVDASQAVSGLDHVRLRSPTPISPAVEIERI